MSCSRRTLSLIFISIFFVSSYILYDYDSKLRVLTLSNSDYRRMTDSLNGRIETLKSELKQIRSSHDSILSERDSTIRRMQRDSQRLDRALSEEKKLKETEDEQLEQLSKSHQRQINELSQLRSRMEFLSDKAKKLDHCQLQYDALLQMYHSLSDSYQELQDSKSSQDTHHSSSVSQDSPGGVLQPAQKSSSSSLPSQKLNLAQPLVHPYSKTNSSYTTTTTLKSSSYHGGAVMPQAPVGVEPPAASHIRHIDSGPKNHKDQVAEPPVEAQPLKHALDYFDRADENDLNDDFNDDADYDGYNKMNLHHPMMEKRRDDVVYHIQNHDAKPVLSHPVHYNLDGAH